MSRKALGASADELKRRDRARWERLGGTHTIAEHDTCGYKSQGPPVWFEE